jgi:hypothetical protein
MQAVALEQAAASLEGDRDGVTEAVKQMRDNYWETESDDDGWDSQSGLCAPDEPQEGDPLLEMLQRDIDSASWIAPLPLPSPPPAPSPLLPPTPLVRPLALGVALSPLLPPLPLRLRRSCLAAGYSRNGATGTAPPRPARIGNCIKGPPPALRQRRHHPRQHRRDQRGRPPESRHSGTTRGLSFPGHLNHDLTKKFRDRLLSQILSSRHGLCTRHAEPDPPTTTRRWRTGSARPMRDGRRRPHTST